MKSKIYLALAFMLAAGQTFAQCGDRYKEEVFQNFTVTTDTYSTANNAVLLVDVYQPVGDVETSRPLIIMAHGGSFVGGNKTQDPTVVSLCKTFAKRGFVAASINYRLGSIVDMANPDTTAGAKTVVMKAVGDGKAAVRFFRKDAATVNKYKIDPELIIGGGNSAGAVLFAHVAYIDSLGELSPNLVTVINANGGIEGNSGNDGYSSKIQALINLAGGLNLPELISVGNPPSANFHGDEDNTVPYNCGDAQGGLIKVRLCGLGAMQPLLTQYNLRHVSRVYSAPNAGHVPWQDDANTYEDMDTVTRNFLYEIVCEKLSVGIKSVAEGGSVIVSPNPAKGQVNVSFGEASFATIQLTDAMGRVVEQKNIDGNTVVSFNRGTLAAGLYFVRAQQANGNTVTKKLIFE